MIDSAAGHLTSSRTLVRNTASNLVSLILPAAVAAFTIPRLVHGLGTDRFGVLTLAWMFSGYFSLFDLGLGRAVTKLVSEKLGASRQHEVPPIVWTSLFLMLLFGCVGGLIVFFTSSRFVYSVLKIPAALQPETVSAFHVLSFSIPIVILTSGLRGVLEALQQFASANRILVVFGIYTYVSPLAVLQFSHSLVPVVAALVAGRLLGALVHFGLCFRVFPALQSERSIHLRLFRPLLRFGGWMTVSNVVGPLMRYLDRFLIGSRLSVSAVSYYVTPFEVLNRYGIIPQAITGVMFPAFSAAMASDPVRAGVLYLRSLKYIFLLLLPIILITIGLGRYGLYLWLGPQFAAESTPVMQWLAVGIFVNGLASVPFALIQGAGRPDLTARLHLIEFPLYLVAVWFLINQYGIAGAAVAWTLRVTVDAAVLLFLGTRFVSISLRDLKSAIVLIAGAFVAFGAAATAAYALPPAVNLGFEALLVLILFISTWVFILGYQERSLLVKQIHLRFGLK